jgi:hypothetical protein
METESFTSSLCPSHLSRKLNSTVRRLVSRKGNLSPRSAAISFTPHPGRHRWVIPAAACDLRGKPLTKRLQTITLRRYVPTCGHSVPPRWRVPRPRCGGTITKDVIFRCSPCLRAQKSKKLQTLTLRRYVRTALSADSGATNHRSTH